MKLFSRINLLKTNYDILSRAKLLHEPDYNVLKNIYDRYCNHKKFIDPIPFILDKYTCNNRDIIGYYNKENLVAYSLILKYPDEHSVLSDQFAWDYYDPKLRLGIKSLEHECAFYKSLGYNYLYLGEHSKYKSKFAGYELLEEEFCLQETT